MGNDANIVTQPPRVATLIAGERFYIIPKETTVVSVVQAFYASLRDQEIRKRINWETVTVKGEEVPITPRDICEFYDTPFYEKDFLSSTDLNKFENIDMEDVIKYWTQYRGTCNYRPDTEFPINFDQVIMFPMMKIWMQFIGTRIVPALNVSNLNTFQAILLYGIL
ncbi:hypothetical protein PVK06_001608 [Gossypium arboreum]|uniref:Putative plant transposon protein domain-containing protein n=1 Tax=Gossypium arboreum TaxID=29729 RepID=A0ABR0R1M2_GOSAR|nr:hypothetical protein PVK06_001608 [Gossypium arboreum]